VTWRSLVVMITTAAPRPGRCWYCGDATLRVGDAAEHVVPASIKGTLTTDRVCFDCNQELRVLDQRFVEDWWVALPRSEYGTPDRRGRTPPLPRQKGTLTDGTPVRINTAGGRWRAQPFPQIRKNADGTFIVSAATEEEAQAAIEQMRKKAGPGAAVSINRVEKGEIANPTVSVETKIDPTLTLRMTIKMALATLSLVWDDIWLETPQAQELRTWLKADRPLDAQGQPLSMLPALPTGALALVCTPPEHVLMLQGAPALQETMFSAILFGEHLTALAIDRAEQPQQERAWWMDGAGGMPVASTIGELVARKTQP
jgi:hypothetical protein